MQYWQIAAGSQGRDYAKDFLRFGMAFVGGPQQMSKMAEVEVGDRVLLKRGMSHIMAVGEVVQRDGKHRGENDKNGSWISTVGSYLHIASWTGIIRRKSLSKRG